MAKESFFIPDEIYINGGTPIKGDVHISGAKNSILGLMCASLLTNEKVVLYNVPHISDVLEMGHILKDLGVDIRFNPEKKVLFLQAKKIKSNILSEKALSFRASYYLWGSLLARFHHTGEFNSLKVLLPGGCSFGGPRKTDFHEKLIENVFGATICEETIKGKVYLSLTLPQKEPVANNPIYTTAKVSHGATFHWLLSVAGTKKHKMMYNSSLEPEVSNLVEMLQKMGLEIDGSERTGLIHKGNKIGLLRGVEHYVIPDRMEAATYALLALGTKGAIRLKGVNYEHCSPWLVQMNQINNSGIYYSQDFKDIVLDFRDKLEFEGITMQMSPFPGMETDLQQVWTPILSQANSASTIVDIIWPGRFEHLKEMQSFGLKSDYKQVDVDAGQGVSYKALIATIKPSKLHAGSATGMDLRGTTGLIIIASMAQGQSQINNPEYSLRGYPNLISNLKQLGVDVKLSKRGRKIESLPFYNVK